MPPIWGRRWRAIPNMATNRPIGRSRQFGLSRLFLHASALTVRLDYMTGSLRVEAPLPYELEQILSALEGKG